MAYKYLVTEKASGNKRLIEASSPANAVAHVAKDGFTTERISDAIADMIGLTLEKVTGDKPAPEAALETEAEKPGKGKAKAEAEAE